MLKKYSKKLIANDLEEYSKIINECYLSNYSDFDKEKFNLYKNKLEVKLENKEFVRGIIAENYAPRDDKNIKKGERCFYTTENALTIDTIRDFIDEIEESMKKYFLAPLLYQASVNTNTAGIFKGFYKDSSTGIGKFGGNGEYALKRIKGKIKVIEPIFSNYECDVEILNEDANELVTKLKGIDIVYIDPPYNQHPYGSNYFMLNLILNNEMPENISKVSGIPKNWNRSMYNYKSNALNAFQDLLKKIDSKYIIISYNSEGIIDYDDMINMLKQYGEVSIKEIVYNTFRGSRNLSERNLYVEEYLFVIKKVR
jgi:adenine-specific DNA-methyltransferase